MKKSRQLPPRRHNTGSYAILQANTYNTIKTGNQWWMAKNLKTTHYANGT